MRRRPRRDGAPGPNRFDSLFGSYDVIYCGTSAEVCFGETLAPLRPTDHLAKLVASDWAGMNVMKPGQVPRDWRERRNVFRAELANPLPFVDIDHPGTHDWLGRDTNLTSALSVLGIDKIDLGVVAGPDRKATQSISETIHAAEGADGRPAYSGIRYASRVWPEWECWAIFDDVDWQWGSPEPILANDANLRE